MSRKITNNEELLSDLMNFSPYGALCQGFIMQGLGQFCDGIIKNKEKMLTQEKENEANGKRGIVSIEAWVGVAEDIKKRMDEFYNR